MTSCQFGRWKKVVTVYRAWGSLIDVCDITEFCQGKHNFRPKQEYFGITLRFSLGAIRNTGDSLNQMR